MVAGGRKKALTLPQGQVSQRLGAKENPLMSALQERHLSPAETARRLGISPKALRLYEARGLLAPIRSQSGWRTYGAKEIATLHHILALKQLGLPLAQIAELLSRRPPALDRLLAAQERALSYECARLGRALSLVRDARAKLAHGTALSIDDLIQLTKETTMTTREQHEEMKAIFDPLVEKHFTEAERAELGARAYDQAEASRAWDGLMAEAKVLMAKGDPGSPEAKDLACRWTAQVSLFTQGDAALAGKVKALWNDAMADPKSAPKLPLNPEIFAFIDKAWKAAQGSEKAL
jgi:DNA-binding transcriptional MerR regulator